MSMDALEAFEAQAERFYKDTGFLAPGKSEPMDVGQYDFDRGEVRHELKRLWDKKEDEISRLRAQLSEQGEALERWKKEETFWNDWNTELRDAVKEAQEHFLTTLEHVDDPEIIRLNEVMTKALSAAPVPPPQPAECGECGCSGPCRYEGHPDVVPCPSCAGKETRP